MKETMSPPFVSVDTDPTNHYYFSAPLDPVKNQDPEYREVPDEVRYNIIFVKVPPFIPKVQEKIELQPKTDEKTTVYVLVKRPEDPKIIELPKPKEVQDEKPEVIVVKYNEDKDIQAVIEGVDQSKIFGDLGLARTSQVSETEVNDGLKKLKKGDINQLKLVADTRLISNQQSTRNGDSKSISISGGDIQEAPEDEYNEDSNPSTVTQKPNRIVPKPETDRKDEYIDDQLNQNNLKRRTKQ